MIQRQTRNFFIDTSVLIAENYNYESTALNALRDRINKGQAKLILPKITIAELEAHIDEDVEKAIQSVKRSRKDARILRNLPKEAVHAIFEDLNPEDLSQKLKKQFSDFLDSTGAEILPIDKARSENVFDLYFDGRPPFGSEKKKSEFPDAFALDALEVWAAEAGKEVYVVSHDSDMAKVNETFPHLVPVRSLKEFLKDLAVDYDELAPLASELLEEHAQEIEGLVKEAFAELGFVLDDQDGEVYGVAPNEVTSRGDFLMEVVRDEKMGHCVATFGVVATISYDAEIVYDDPDSTWYDSEEKVSIAMHQVDETVTRSAEVAATVAFRFSVAKLHLFEVLDVTIQHPRDIYVTAIDFDEWLGK